VDTHEVSKPMEIDEHTVQFSSIVEVSKPLADKDLIQCSSESVSQSTEEQSHFSKG